MCTSFGISSVLSQSVGGERPEIGNFSRSLGLSDVVFVALKSHRRIGNHR